MLLPGGGDSPAAAPAAAPVAAQANVHPRGSLKPRAASPAASPRRALAASPRRSLAPSPRMSATKGPAPAKQAAPKQPRSAQAGAELDKLKRLAKEIVEESSKPKQR